MKGRWEQCRFGRGGFSLVEMLVVLAIIVLVAAMAVPVLGLGKSQGLSQGVQLLSDQLGYARQAAVSQNCRVEVRFYLTKPGVSGARACRSFQLFQILPSGSVLPISKVIQLPEPAIIDTGSKLSSLLDESKRSKHSGSDPLPGAGTDYEYFDFSFLPDGNTDLSASSEWFVTLHLAWEGDGRNDPPRNYGTVQVDPVNGAVRIYRP